MIKTKVNLFILFSAFLFLSNKTKGSQSELMKSFRIFKILTIALFIVSCGRDRPLINMDESNVSITFVRIEKELYSSEVNGEISFELFSKLKSDYPQFMKLYLENIASVGNFQDSVTLYYLNQTLKNSDIRELFKNTISYYDDTEDIEIELNCAFRRYNVLFPENPIPTVYSFISGFNYQIIVDSNLLGISLDSYLGSENDYYKKLGRPRYKVKNYNRENIAADAIKGWLITEFDMPSENTDLLSHMVYHGKLLYALDLLLPETPDSVKLGYSSAEMKWVEDNEKDMWFHFAENELLYNKEGKQIQKYIGEAPFTPGFPEGSPGMTGRWIGWQIVKKYMKNTDPLAIKALFEAGDAQKILKISKYKPT